MKLKFANALSLALIMAMLFTSIGLADNVQNDVVAVDGDKIVTITSGDSAIINYRIQQTGQGNDGQNGCNAADGSSATVTINTPAQVTVDTSGSPGNQATLIFTSCGNEAQQPATFTSNTPGTYTIAVSVSDSGTGSYTTNQAAFTLYVNAPPVQNQTITFAPLADKTYGDPDFNVSATSSSGLPVSFSAAGNCTVSGNTVHLTGAGSCSITASQAGNASYNPAPTVTRSFDIAKADANCSISGYSGTYDGSAHGASGSCAGTGTLDLGASFTDVPGGTAHWTYSGDNNYNNAAGDATITISQASSLTTVTVSNATFDGNAHGGSAVVTGAGGLNQNLPVTYVGRNGTNYPSSATAPTNVGDYTASASFGGDINHTGSSDSKDFSIGKATSTVTVDCTVGAPFTYTGLAQTPCTAKALGAGMSDVNVTSSLVYHNNTNAGTATVDASWGGDANHTGSTGSGSFTIAQASSIVIIDCSVGAPFTYTGSAQTPCTAKASGVGMDDVDVTSSLIYHDNLNAGTATVEASWAGDANHSGNTASGSFTIAKANATCSISGFSGPYDTTSHAASGSCSGIGGEDAGTLDLGASFKDVPGGTAHWVFTGNNNYNNAEGDVAITITKADATCSVSGYSGVYDAASHGASGSCSGIGGENAGSLNFGDSFKDVPGGTAHWVFTGNGNYKDQGGDVAITITKADATCSVSGYSGVYDAASHGATGSCSGIGGENAGTLDLGASFKNVSGGTAHWVFTGNGNYKNQSGDAPITITQADATCSVSGYSGVYDAAAHGATGTCSGIGAENAGTLDLGASFTDVPGGTAHWAFTGNGNYKDQSGDVSIDISKAPSTVTVTCGGPYTYTGSAQTPCTAEATGVGMNPVDVTASLSYLNNTNAGTATAEASWVGDDNHFDSTGSGSFTIDKANATCVVTGYNVYFDNSDHTATGSCTGVLGEALSGLNLSGTTHKFPGTWTDPWTFTDVTGNYSNTTGTVADKIGAWTYGGFYQPVDMGNVLNTVKNGSTVPLKFEIFAGPTELTDTADVKSITTSQYTCTAGVPEDAIETLASTTGGSALRYDTLASQFIFNWKTPSGSSVVNKCYRVTMETLDGSKLIAFFKLK